MADDTTTETMPVEPHIAKLMFAITHTGRMHLVKEAHAAMPVPEGAAPTPHKRAGEYKRQLTIYRGLWAAAADEDKAIALHAVANDPSIRDLDESTIAAANAALEGD